MILAALTYGAMLIPAIKQASNNKQNAIAHTIFKTGGKNFAFAVVLMRELAC